ncbi:helix-turn-helix domain-containing protein [Enterococcus mundtii]|uniref:helix-turn-helix domain-containing protein n=1 Tax=Enterococcus mundtii TaxID=53346 RepID=UPI0032DF9CDA
MVSRETLAKYENGKNHLPLLVFLELLERLNMTIDEFMFYLDGDKVSQKNLSLKKIFRNLEKK